MLQDFFYLPIIRDVDYRIALQTGQRAPSIIDQALIEAIEKADTTQFRAVFNVSDKYWKRYSGADHIIVMPAPVTNLRHQTSMRGFFHYVSISYLGPDSMSAPAYVTILHIPIFSLHTLPDDPAQSSYFFQCGAVPLIR